MNTWTATIRMTRPSTVFGNSKRAPITRGAPSSTPAVLTELGGTLVAPGEAISSGRPFSRSLPLTTAVTEAAAVAGAGAGS